METIVLSPNSQLFSNEISTMLIEKYAAKFFEKNEELSTESLSSDSEKIVMVDPDFFEWKLSSETLAGWNNVTAVLLQTTSYDWLDVSYMKDRGIPVLHIPNYSTNSVAESVCAAMIILARRYPVLMKSQVDPIEQNKIAKDVGNKSIGIIGLGSIGSAVAKKALNFGLHVSYWSQNSRNSDYEYMELEDIFTTCDFIVPALKADNETRELITDELLKSIRSDASFISVIPKIYNHQLLLDLAASSKIWGYAFEYELSDGRSEFEGNVLSIPANAFSTDVSISKNIDIWISNLEASRNGSYPNKVN